MAVFIPSTLLDIAKDVHVELDLNKLSDKQMKNIERAVKRGVVSHWSRAATAIIARYLLNTYNAPQIKYSTWRFTWEKLKQDNSLFDELVASASLRKLEVGDNGPYDYAKTYTQDVITIAELRRPYDSIYVHCLHSAEVARMIKTADAKVDPNSPMFDRLKDIVERKETTLKIGVDEWNKLF